jgi:hypothetical protein
MKLPYFLLIGVLCSGLLAETVVKNSAAFSFPTTVVGILAGNALQNKESFFVGSASLAGRKTVTLSWSLPVKTARGTITIFSLSGAKIKSFPIATPQGYVTWDIGGMGRVANGLCFATLSCGSIKKNLHLMLCR